MFNSQVQSMHTPQQFLQPREQDVTSVVPQLNKSDGSTKREPKRRSASGSPVENDRNSPNKSQIVLTRDQAMEIYGLRTVTHDHSPRLAEIAGKSALVAEVYGVSPKTIRDIWNRKTWAQATRHFWTEQETSVHAFEHVKSMLPSYMPGYSGSTELPALKPKARGRPIGSKDSRPRKKRAVKPGEGEEDSGGDEAASLQELKDEIAEWAAARSEMLSGRNEACGPTPQLSNPAVQASSTRDVEQLRSQTVDQKHFIYTNPSAPGFDYRFPSSGAVQAPAPCREPRGVPAEWNWTPDSFQSMGWKVPSMPNSPNLLPSEVEPRMPVGTPPVRLPTPMLDALHNDPRNCAPLGPPPRLDVGLDECLRAMTECESLNKVRMTLDMALQPSPEARVITEANGPFRIVHVNESWSKLCGFSNRDVVGQSLKMIQGPATDESALRELMTRIKAREEARTMLVNYKKNGYPFLNNLNVSPLVDQEGVVTHYMGVLEDVTLKDYLHPLAHYVRDLRTALGFA